MYYSNVLFTEAILRQSLESNKDVRVLVAGSIHQHSLPTVEDKVIFVDTKQSPRNIYGFSKSVNQLQVKYYRDLGLHASFAILFNHESSLRSSKYLLPKLCSLAAKLKLSTQKNSGVFPKAIELKNVHVRVDWSDAELIVKSFASIIQKDKPLDYVLGSGHVTSVLEVIRYIEKNIAPGFVRLIDLDEPITGCDGTFLSASLICGEAKQNYENLGVPPTNIYYLVEKLVSEYLEQERSELLLKGGEFG
jgi:GDP-D-mannose dehydratase